jgi:hypothetical protein
MEKIALANAQKLATMPGVGPETGGVPWDPLNLASPEYGAHPSKLEWYRHAELKHGRICMFAIVGWITTSLGFTWSGDIAPGLAFSDLGTAPLEVWGKIPAAGQAQIIAAIGAVEIQQEMRKPHYLRGGTPGDVDFKLGISLWDPLQFQKNKSEEAKRESLTAELKNGRLAMIGLASLVSATIIPGSVPLLK